MATKVKVMSKEQIDDLYQRTQKFIQKESQPANTLWQIKTKSGIIISAYKSGKVVFAGNDLDFLDEPDDEQFKVQKAEKMEKISSYPQAGSDEVGTGDFFGPIVVCAAVVPDEKTAEELKKLKVTDSKAMTDSRIKQIAPILEEMLPHSVLVTTNRKYNQIHEQTKNIKVIVSMLHNQAYLNLIKNGVKLPEQVIIDQFCPPATYFRYLSNVNVNDVVKNIHFETKAESKYPAVAAASVIARARFLKVMDDMSDKYGVTFNKGGGRQADQSGIEFLKKHSPEQLRDVAKIHFTNMNKIGADDYKEGAPLSLFSTIKIETDEIPQISKSHQTKTQSALTSNQKTNNMSLENIDNKEKDQQANAFNSSQNLDSDHDKSIGISSKTFNELSLKELYEILKARVDIFVVEQQCAYPEIDGIDYSAIHYQQHDSNGNLLAYLRIYPDSEKENTWHIGRVITTMRKQGYGQKLLHQAVEDLFNRHHADEITLEAQTYAIPFYQKEGFKVISEPFDDAGIMHVNMSLKKGLRD